MQLGLAVAEALGEEDTSTNVDFFYCVRSLLRRGQIAEPEDRPLRRQGDSSDAGRPRKKTKISGVIIHDDKPAIVRDVPPPTFPCGRARAVSRGVLSMRTPPPKRPCLWVR